jgi:hypothetical protein
MEEYTYKTEVHDDITCFSHRIVRSDGHTSQWGRYEDAIYMDGRVQITCFYASGSKYCIISADEFCKLACIK